MATPALNKEEAVRERYAEGARKSEASLCCPTSYDPALLKAIPDEVLSIDYGCGDPTKYVHAGDTVLDLGSGSGKNCFVACQIAGPTGRVIGVDMTDAMLEVDERKAPEVARRLGYANVEFRKGKIQDLRLNMAEVDAWLAEHPVRTAEDLAKLESIMDEMRSARPLVPDDSVDVVISNCVLNLVRPEDKKLLFKEIFRALKRGGRAVISDIVSDEDVPIQLQQNAELWSGCISAAFREDLFLDAFDNAGFHCIELLDRQQDQWHAPAQSARNQGRRLFPYYRSAGGLLLPGRSKERVLLMAVANSPFPIFPSGNGYAEGFAQTLRENGQAELLRAETTTLQINVGKLCNQACHHCHVDAGPKRTEIMLTGVARRVIELLAASPSITTVDITGGAPEMNPNFRWLVEESQRLGRHVIDRCNLTVLLEDGQQDLAEFLAARRVEIIASLPFYTAENVDKQRGEGVFEKSMDALRELNRLGYGMPGSELMLNLVYNPVGPSLPPPQAMLEAYYNHQLREEHGIELHHLPPITHMPIHP